MKKRFFAIAAVVACLFSMSSCDGINWDDMFDNLTGHITLMASSPQNAQSGAQPQGIDLNDSIRFKSAISNVTADTIYYDGQAIPDVNFGTLMVGTKDNILTNDIANLTYPLVGIHLNGNTVKVYNVSCPLNFDFIEYLDTTDINQMIAAGMAFGNDNNLFAVAVSEDAYYIGYTGNVNITKFGDEGSLIEGRVNNVRAIYVTKQQIETLADMSDAERAAIDLETYFPSVKFNGEISSRRTNIQAVLDALEAEQQ